MVKVEKAEVGESARAFARLPRIDYEDAFSAKLISPPPPVDAIVRRMFASPPAWARSLMRLRDAAVRPFGLKTLPPARPADGPLEEGATIGLFRIFLRRPLVVVFGQDDTHLDFRVPVEVAADGDGHRVTISTFVAFRNGWGRAYFVPVKPFHGLVVRSMLQRALTE